MTALANLHITHYYSRLLITMERVRDKNGETIYEDDLVSTRYRGGSHRGKVIHSLPRGIILPALLLITPDQVEKIVTDEAGAREEGVANPPKVE